MSIQLIRHLNKLRTNPAKGDEVSGHGFSRAVRGFNRAGFYSCGMLVFPPCLCLSIWQTLPARNAGERILHRFCMQFPAFGTHYLFARILFHIQAPQTNDPRSTKKGYPPASRCATVQLCRPRHITQYLMESNIQITVTFLPKIGAKTPSFEPH
jgi:hypothetical protein